MRQVQYIAYSICVGSLLMFTLLMLILAVPVADIKAAGMDGKLSPPQVVFSQPTTAAVSHPSTTVSFDPIQVISHSGNTTDVAQLARGLALAMDIPEADLESAVLMCDSTGQVCTDPAAVAVMGMAPGTWFPTRGEQFALLSTGLATDVLRMSTITPTSASQNLNKLDGLNNDYGHDLVRLQLVLNVPSDARCLSVDFTFYTVDLPLADAACSQNSGDIFTIQYNNSDMSISDEAGFTELIAPENFAENGRDGIVSTGTMSPTDIFKALAAPLGSTITGVFPLLQARHEVIGGEQITLFVSIQDMQDSLTNSAVALDNFTWIRMTETITCETGVSGDTDGDGLPDGWEKHGKSWRTEAGDLQTLNLKAMGARPETKDIFVEIDYLPPLGSFDPKPISSAISSIVSAFARSPHDTGIQLHVDYGFEAPLRMYIDNRETITYWGGLSRGEQLPPEYNDQYFCEGYCNEEFGVDPVFWRVAEIKQQHFEAIRAPIFHYAIFAHQLAECTQDLRNYYTRTTGSDRECINLQAVSGISNKITDTRHGASDFIVTLAHSNWSGHGEEYLRDAQAGTFMHELGHNLALNHYGVPLEQHDTNEFMLKPNHLSVMNYLYQTKGLVVTDPTYRFDYARYNLFDLNEENLNEDVGILIKQPTEGYTIGARYYCGFSSYPSAAREAADGARVDWNCKPPLSTTIEISANINGDFVWAKGKQLISDTGQFQEVDIKKPITSTLKVATEWDKLVFTGGLLNRQRSMLQSYVALRGSLCETIETTAIEFPIPDPSVTHNLPPNDAPFVDVPFFDVPVTNIYIQPQTTILPSINSLLIEELIVIPMPEGQ